MADETQTAETNSDQATQTDASAETTTTTSTTEPTTPNSEGPPSDPLDGDDLLAPGESDEDKAARETEEARRAALTDEERAAEDAEKAAAETPLHGAPDGDYEIELPEGMSLDADALTEIAPLAKELNLSNKGLSLLAEKGLPVAQKMAERSMVEAVVATRKAWADDARAYVQGGKLQDGTDVPASPVFAGENIDAVTQTSRAAINRFASDEAGQPLMFPAAKINAETGEPEPGTFYDFLKTTGLANHPALLFVTYKVGKAIGEDSDFERSGDTPQSKLSREAKYFPHLQPPQT